MMMNNDSAAESVFRSDLLAVADTKLVLGNWYGECVINGRALPDFAALLGMANANFGHARALYKHLSTPESYAELERGRGAAEIASMNLLDCAPRDWEDFLASAWLAEQATWHLLSGYIGASDRTVSGIVRRVGQEVYFHIRYFEGWLAVLAGDNERTRRFQKHFAERFPLALRWLESGETDDEEIRRVPMEAIRRSFIDKLGAGSKLLGAPLNTSSASSSLDEWSARLRRSGPLPAGLFEVVRFKDPALAH